MYCGGKGEDEVPVERRARGRVWAQMGPFEDTGGHEVHGGRGSIWDGWDAASEDGERSRGLLG